VRRLGWGYFTLEAEIILKAPYTWIVGSSGTRQRGLELTWTLDFEGRGRQGRVKARVKKLEVEGRTLRNRSVPTRERVNHNGNGSHDEDDDDYEENDEDENQSQDEEEDISEFMDTPRR
jgi:hypothetical protein